MIGNEIHNFARELWPLNRSLTGEGVRETLKKIKEHLPNLKIHSIPSGTQVFDWTIPKEWKVNSAYIISPSGKKICDFSKIHSSAPKGISIGLLLINGNTLL